MSEYNAAGPIVVWHNFGMEGWQPRSFRNVLAAAKEGIDGGDVVTILVPPERYIKEPNLPIASIGLAPRLQEEKG